MTDVFRVSTVQLVQNDGDVDFTYRVLTSDVIVAESIGDALNAKVPDPREGATFIVDVIARDVKDAR